MHSSFLIAIPSLSFSDERVVIPFDQLQVIIGKLASLLFQFTFELHPLPLKPVRIHATLLSLMVSFLQLPLAFP